MENLQFCFDYKRFKIDDTLPEDYSRVIQEARKACKHAYAPFSGFKVGAAALLESGRIISSSNQESNSFPASICAEQNLLSYHNAHMANDKITILAIASLPDDEECYPCGVCRQVLVDTQLRQGNEIQIIMCSAKTAVVVNNALFLMPFAFNFNNK